MNLNDMSTSDLLALYNEKAKALNEKPVKRFADRKTALRRTAEIVKIANGVDAEESAARAAPKATKPAKAKAEKAAPSGRTADFTAPMREGGPQAYREGTNRAKLIEFLTDGVGHTFEECVAKGFYPDRRNTYEAIKYLNTYVGFGIQQTQDGRLKLIGRPRAS